MTFTATSTQRRASIDWIALMVALLGAAAACSDAPSTPATVGCRLHSDCAQDQRCLDGACVDRAACEGPCPCAGAEDCAFGERCAEAQCVPATCVRTLDCGLGEACEQGECVADLEADRDRDGVPDGSASQPRDNCPSTPNPGQDDLDADGAGDDCDEDDDGDGVADHVDNCPRLSNPGQFDADGNGDGNACDENWQGATVRGRLVATGDLVPDFTASRVRLSGLNAPATPDSQGAFVFADALDAAGVFAVDFECPGFLPGRVTFAFSPQSDELDLGDLAITAREVALRGHVRLDGQQEHADVIVRSRRDGVLVQTTVSDADGTFVGRLLPLPHVLTLSATGYRERTLAVQFDEVTDGGTFTLDGEPLDATPIVLLRDAVADRDADGVIDAQDTCPDVADPLQIDLDGDGRGDLCDADLDGDGIANGVDNCPNAFNPSQEDPDGDGLGVTCHDGSWELPFDAGCGVTRQHVDTRRRVDRVHSACGGAGAPEIVYGVNLAEGDVLEIRVESTFVPVVSLFDEDGDEVTCDTGGHHTLEGLPAGAYRLVVDGFSGPLFAGPLAVTLRNDHCALRFDPPSPLSLPLDGAPDSVASADFNNDGRLDIATTLPDEDLVSISQGQGGSDGLFRPPVTVAVGDTPRGIAAGDVDNDGNADLVTADLRDGAVSVLWGDGATAFQRDAVAVGANSPEDVALADLNGDGRLDIVTANRTDRSLSVLLSGPLPRRFFPPRLIATTGFPVGVFAGLVGDDDLPDVLAVYGNTNQVAVFDGDGQGGLAAPRLYTVAGTPQSATAADVNGDGRPDLLVAGNLADAVFVLLANPSGDFDPAVVVPAGNDPVELAVVDFDEDGLPDILSCNHFSDDVSFLRGDGAGGFAVAQQALVGGRPLGLVVDDLDNQPGLDVVTIDSSANTLTVLPSPRPGQLAGAARHAYQPGIDAEFAAHGDVNGDGLADVVTLSSRKDTVVVLFGTPTPGLVPGPALPIAAGPIQLALAHLDDDDHLDLAVTTADDKVELWRGDGAGGFELTTTVATDGTARWLTVADLDNDGDNDLVAACPAEGTMTLITLDGHGGVSESRQLVPGDRMGAPRVDDLDGDGQPDLVLPLANASAIVVLFGDGLSFVQTVLTDIAITTPTRLELTDTNQDGYPDILFANSDSDAVTVALSHPSRAFVLHRVGTQPSFTDLAVADLNADSLPDVILSTTSPTEPFGVFGGDGLGRFAPLTPPRVDFLADSLWFDDLNRDAQLDLFGIDRGHSDVHVLPATTDSLLLPVTRVAPIQDALDVVALDLPAPSPPTWLVAAGGRNTLDRIELVTLPNGTIAGTSRRLAEYNDNSVDFVLKGRLAPGRCHDVLIFGGPVHAQLRRLLCDDLIAGAAPVLLDEVDLSFPPLSIADQSVVWADLNGDGYDDLASADGAIRIWLNDGTGHFLPPRTLATPSSVQLLAAADSDHDGDLDLVAVAANAHRLLAFQNTGDGTFAAAPTADLAIGAAVGRIDAGDLDLDGDDDVVLTTLSGSRVSIALSDGDGGYTAAEPLQLGAIADTTTLADVNADGLLDLLVAAAAEPPALIVLLNERTGFGPAHTLTTAAEVAHVRTDDLNADGRPDLLIAGLSGVYSLRSRFNLRAGTHALDTPLPPCAPITLPATRLTPTGATWSITDTAPCRVDRLALLLDADAPLDLLDLRSPRHTEPIHLNPAADPTRWTPEHAPALARFEGHPLLNGLWSLQSPSPLRAAALQINTLPADPFATPSTPACDAATDQADLHGPPCILPAATPLPASAASPTDADAFLLDGPLAGALLAGDLVTLTLTAPDAAAFDLDLLPYNALQPVTAEVADVAPDTRVLAWRVPATFDRRAFLARVTPHTPGAYTLQFDAGPDAEAACTTWPGLLTACAE